MQCPECRQHDVEAGQQVCWWCATTLGLEGDSARLPEPTFTPEPGTTLRDTWKLADRLGEGGMGTVFLAEEVHLGRTVAIKFLATHLCRDVTAVRRFWREARLAARVEHPHIVPIHSVGEEGGRPFLVMKHLGGQTLADALTERARFTLDEAWPLLSRLAAGVDALHRAGVVHRDLKAANVVLTADNHPWLVDFGISTQLDADPLTRAGGLMGTAGYVAPEVISGGAAASSARSDQYAFAVLAYQLLTGDLPFPLTNPLLDVELKRKGQFTAPSVQLPELGPGVDAAFVRALAPKSAERFATVSAFVEALRQSEPVAAGSRPMVAVAAGMVAAGVAVLLAAAVFMLRPPTPAPHVMTTTPVALPVAAVEPVAVDPEPAEADDSNLDLDPLAVELDGTPSKKPRKRHATTTTPAPAAAAAAGEVSIITQLGGESTWARLSVDGVAVRNAPTRLSLSPGRHALTIDRPGAKSVARTISVVPGTNPVIEIRLDPL